MNQRETPTGKSSKIKLVVTDVDGVLTDGGLYYTSEGLVMKKFNVKDGMGVRLLRENGIKNAIITTDTSDLITIRGERLKVDYVFLGIWDKKNKLLEICNSEKILPENVAFIGDDVNDNGIIDIAGFTACPNDAVDEIKDRVDLVLTKKGGEGVFREFSDLILHNQANS
jgi:YrbI family 3-deoxy-D-manno-octulosonate 8-phosphate phosphatase